MVRRPVIQIKEEFMITKSLPKGKQKYNLKPVLIGFLFINVVGVLALIFVPDASGSREKTQVHPELTSKSVAAAEATSSNDDQHPL
jgi:hypothetical protein